jgi:hypothetical protein
MYNKHSNLKFKSFRLYYARNWTRRMLMKFENIEI